jgi:hypothetical protein
MGRAEGRDEGIRTSGTPFSSEAEAALVVTVLTAPTAEARTARAARSEGAAALGTLSARENMVS